jgi:transposase
VDSTGKIVREVKVASEPDALRAVLRNPAYHFKRIGLEAGPLSQWLFSALAEAELPVICVETRHMRAVLKAQINKTDRNDARGIAQMMRVGLYRRVHVKTLRSQKLRMLLTHRKLCFCSRRPSPLRMIYVPPYATSVSRWVWWGRPGLKHASRSW